jgi:DNA polymerase-3 subunit epsilon
MLDRIVAIDVETTGVSPEGGDKIIEIAAIEMIDLQITSNVFHQYINPNITISDSLSSVTGITASFLETQPCFPDVASKLIEFIGASKLLSSNGSFDLHFLNHELSKLSVGDLEQNQIIDLLKLSREHFPSEPANLDYYVDKFNINLEEIDAKGAILDATITALVFQRCFYEIYNAGK